MGKTLLGETGVQIITSDYTLPSHSHARTRGDDGICHTLIKKKKGVSHREEWAPVGSVLWSMKAPFIGLLCIQVHADGCWTTQVFNFAAEEEQSEEVRGLSAAATFGFVWNCSRVPENM